MSSGLRLALRFAASLAAMFVVWATSSIARADAPQCDRRGAITFAEAPTLQIRDVSIDVGMSESCGDAKESVVYLERDTPSAPIVSMAEAAHDAVLPDLALVSPQDFVVRAWPRTISAGSLAGVATSLERPPR